MATLTAKVTKVTGRTRHAVGQLDGDSVRAVVELSAPAAVRIEPLEGAFFLVYLDKDGQSITDTWHQTLDDAKGQAEFEFGITEKDWEMVDDDQPG